MNAVDTAVFGELTHHQPVFTTADVIKTTGGSPVWATQSLSALAKEGLIAKVRRGLWALPGHADFSPYAIIPQLLRATKGEKTDVRGYVSLLSALNLHGMIDQAPHVIQIVAERIRPTVRTPFGTYQFHRLDPALIGGYGPYRNTGNLVRLFCRHTSPTLLADQGASGGRLYHLRRIGLVRRRGKEFTTRPAGGPQSA
jgi:hypothetical protein